jgi:DNA-binding Lrp family transcriptional regulator
MADTTALDAIDRTIINQLQGDFPICERPYRTAAERLGIAESDLIARIERLLERGVLSRFGPMFDAERLGGSVTLCALTAPERNFDNIADIINRFPEVAHNYARNHELNMWFVLATEKAGRIPEVIREIEQATGCHIYNLPKLDEFYIGLRLEV